MRLLMITCLLMPLGVFAQVPGQQATEVYSRALQQAKRVANLENNKDLPSRAYWLSSRVVKQSKKAISSYKGSKKPSTTRN